MKLYTTRKIDGNDVYCRYLNIGLSRFQSPSNGRFGDFLRTFLGIKKLPYDLKLKDIIIEKCFSVDLFVDLPEECFTKWINYPINPARFSESLTDLESTAAAWYYLDIPACTTTSTTELRNLRHLYDGELKETFVDVFSSTIPQSLELKTHPNDRSYYSHEAYLQYWRSYILLEALEECKFIGKYLPKEVGIINFKENLKCINDFWNEEYKETFNRISQYKTIISSMKNVTHTRGDITNYILDITNSNYQDLDKDMEKLLKLHQRWIQIEKDHGLRYFEKALKILKLDIYYLFELLIGSGSTKEQLLEQWDSQSRFTQERSDLSEVLDFEEIVFKKFFLKLIPNYISDISKWSKDISINDFYERFETYSCFRPWIRAFVDLHKSIINRELVNFVQPRTLDYLLILTVRTESLVRAIYRDATRLEDKDHLIEVFSDYALFFNNEKLKIVFKCFTGKENWSVTKLNHKPCNLFDNVDQLSFGSKWEPDYQVFSKSVLKFVTARNYFAHHEYKDDEFDLHINSICSTSFQSCIKTVMYLMNLVIENNTN